MSLLRALPRLRCAMSLSYDSDLQFDPRDEGHDYEDLSEKGQEQVQEEFDEGAECLYEIAEDAWPILQLVAMSELGMHTADELKRQAKKCRTDNLRALMNSWDDAKEQACKDHAPEETEET